MTGLIIVMVQGGSMDMKSGLFIILGANIGSCLTAIISTLGKSLNSRRTGIICLFFKTFGTFVFTVITWLFDSKIIKILEKINKNPAMQIAWFNVFFKLFSTLISLPIIKIFVLISTKIIKGEHDKRKVKQWRKAFNHINRRFLKVPEIAEEQIKKEIKDIMDLSRKNMNINVSEILEQNNHYTEEIYVTNDLINFLNFDLVKFLVKLSQQVKSELSDETTNNFLLLNHIIKINRYIAEINEINIAMKNKEIKFDENSIKSINSLNELINQLFDLAIKYIDNIQDNKNGSYMAITEKFKYLKNNLFQEKSNNIII